MIATGYTDEIAASAREVLEREAPREGVLARLRGEPFARHAWQAAAGVGWFRLLTAERAGGLQAGPAELAALFRQIGRHLPAAPFAASVVAGGLLRDFAELGSDELVVCFPEAGLYEHGATADLLLIPGPDAISALDRADAVLRPLASVDLVGHPARLESGAGRPLLEGAEARELLDRIRLLLAVAGVAELAGVAAELLEMTVAYAKERVQFARPIGAFQAVQQRVAEMAVASAAIESALSAAVSLAEGTDPERATRVGALRAYAAELTREVAESALQVHGGIGFTDEHRLHVYLKRALRLQAVAAASDPLLEVGGRLLAR